MTKIDTDASGVKHTPGPWQVDDQLRVLDANDNEVCLPSIGAQLFEAKDNARLIAAAPDMLAALRACKGYLAVEVDGEVPTAQEHFDLVRAAIAKAEGRS